MNSETKPNTMSPAEAARNFVKAFNDLAEFVHLNNISKGWWEKDRNDYELIALMHSELSEALEGLRHGNPADDHIPAFKCTEAEFADTIIRIMDQAHARKWRVGEAVEAKFHYNTTRPYRHGQKLA